MDQDLALEETPELEPQPDDGAGVSRRGLLKKLGGAE